jgi:hypothetical protein
LILLLSSGLNSALAQVPTNGSDTLSKASADPAQVRAYLAFRQGMAVAVKKAESGDTAGASTALESAIAAGQNRFDLPKLPDILSDTGAKVPGSLMKDEAVTQGMPYWTLEALVRWGATDAAEQAARQQSDPLNRYRALCLVAVAQAGRYVNAPYILPPVVEDAPEKWVTRTDVAGTTPGMVRALQVVSLQGPVFAPLLDCRSLEKQGSIDNTKAYATLQEAEEAIKPLREIWLFRELSEVQGKMGDKAGALATVHDAADTALADWPTVKNNKERGENARREIGLLATDLEALGDKPRAEYLRKVLAANDFQQIWLPLFLTINIGAVLIAVMMRRASKTSWASRAGETGTVRL